MPTWATPTYSLQGTAGFHISASCMAGTNLRSGPRAKISSHTAQQGQVKGMIPSVTWSDSLERTTGEHSPANDPYTENKWVKMITLSCSTIQLPHPEQTLERNLLPSRTAKVRNFPLLMVLSPADHSPSQKILLKEMSLPVFWRFLAKLLKQVQEVNRGHLDLKSRTFLPWHSGGKMTTE